MKSKYIYSTVILFAFLVCTEKLSAQHQKITGIWNLETVGARKLPMTLSIGSHKNKLYGEFDSPPIGRGSFDQISAENNTLTVQVTLGTNFVISANLELVDGDSIQGKFTIYGTPMNVVGKRSSKIIDSSANEGQAAWSPDGRSIAFTSNQYGNKDIVLADVGGKWQKNLTNHDGADYGAAWSPDGKVLAFISNRSGSNQIYTISHKGRNLKQITTSALAYDLIQWSPDGSKLLFSTPQGPYLMNADGSDLKNLTNQAQAVYSRFSPDGNHISVTLVDKNVYNIAKIDIKTLELTNLSNSTTPDFNQRWSPDGKSLVWISRRDGNPEVYKMGPDGSNVKRLTNNANRDNNPSWSSDGQKVIWESRQTAKSEVHLMNADGTGVMNLSNHDQNDIDPVWSPDGRLIVFTSERNGNPKLFTVKPDGTGLKRLTKD